MAMTTSMIRPIDDGANCITLSPSSPESTVRDRAPLMMEPTTDGDGRPDGTSEEADEDRLGAEHGEDGLAAHPHGLHQPDLTGSLLHAHQERVDDAECGSNKGDDREGVEHPDDGIDDGLDGADLILDRQGREALVGEVGLDRGNLRIGRIGGDRGIGREVARPDVLRATGVLDGQERSVSPWPSVTLSPNKVSFWTPTTVAW